MYKLVLCLRYLRTRYIALASIVSVTLGVMTMIVVNSVMSGFTTEMESRIHGILSDVVLETRNLGGEPDAEKHMEVIRQAAGDSIEGMTTTVVVPAMLSFRFGENWINRQVQLIGIDETTINDVSDFSKYLQHPENRAKSSFDLRTGGFDVRDHQSDGSSPERTQMARAGWEHRRAVAKAREMNRAMESLPSFGRPLPEGANPFGPPNAPPKRLDQSDPAQASVVPELGADGGEPFDPFQRPGQPQEPVFDPAKQQHPGVVMGIVISSIRLPTGEDRFLVLPGDDIALTFPNAPGAGDPPKAVNAKFTIVDFYECKMSEYDASFVFVPIRELQNMRGMIEPATGVARFNSILMKLKPGADGDVVRDKIRAALPAELYIVQTWRDKQGPLLAAVHMETAILNVLLFLIIAVSGFGILAIFFMIVVEKTRDIGILKSLGASATGIMGIFLAYGLALGLVGSGAGMVLGLLVAHDINKIADVLGRLTGRPVFDPSIYYFYKIPVIIDPWTVAWIVLGAVGIAIMASILPAIRAASMRPVQALRYE